MTEREKHLEKLLIQAMSIVVVGAECAKRASRETSETPAEYRKIASMLPEMQEWYNNAAATLADNFHPNQGGYMADGVKIKPFLNIYRGVEEEQASF